MTDSQWASPQMPKKVQVPAKAHPQNFGVVSGKSKSDEFWSQNPQGVTVDALFGGQGGTGEWAEW